MRGGEKGMTLSETVEKMNSSDYKERFIAEYQQLNIRYKKLKDFCNKIEVSHYTAAIEPEHDCPLDLLRAQQYLMGMYLSILETRAIIENISLDDI